jgi:hypothetical protein
MPKIRLTGPPAVIVLLEREKHLDTAKVVCGMEGRIAFG